MKKLVCKRVGRFVYSEKKSECRTQAIFPRKEEVFLLSFHNKGGMSH